MRSLNGQHAGLPYYDSGVERKVFAEIGATVVDLIIKYNKRRTEVLAKNAENPINALGHVDLKDRGDVVRALSLYNSIDPYVAPSGGVDADRETKVDRMLSDAALWTSEAVDELIVPELLDYRENILPWRTVRDGPNFIEFFGGMSPEDSLELAIGEVIALDEALASLSERAPQHRVDEEKSFTEIITWYSR